MALTVDLRSDTVTKPSPAMRAAMAAAVVDDDVVGRDPTMVELEERTAALLGKEAGLYLVSGCMSNLTALMTHLHRGDRFLAPRHAHILSHELGTAAHIALGVPLELPWTYAPGVPAPADVAEVAAEEPAHHSYYELITRLLCLENSHNHAGGFLIPQDVNDALIAEAHQAGWQVHLDGARIWHSAAAQGITPAAAAGAADSVSVCFSKGLGAPVGSVLVGSKDFIEGARRNRKILGGGIRQGGVLAAACLVALDEELPRIDQDRVRADRLAAGLREMGFDAPAPQTNILLVTPPAAWGLSAPQLAQTWTEAGIGCHVMGPAVRLVTHRDIGDSDIATALELIAASVPR
ncbi:MAG: hypothetical protein LBR27_05470 [Bifidobacteriaceae bacterium]|jgi:threonine aldolase|nr:hypothetical protein [Bifidobacteriaceae bacterium]